MLLVEFSRETLQARKEGCNVLKVMKGKKKLQRRLLYPARIALDLKEKSKALQTSKSEENSAPPNQLTKNTKGTSLGRTQKKK